MRILGKQPTNNQSIELQLSETILWKAHIQLLSAQPNCTSDMSEELSRAVVKHALQNNSLNHLDESLCMSHFQHRAFSKFLHKLLQAIHCC